MSKTFEISLYAQAQQLLLFLTQGNIYNRLRFLNKYLMFSKELSELFGEVPVRHGLHSLKNTLYPKSMVLVMNAFATKHKRHLMGTIWGPLIAMNVHLKSWSDCGDNKVSSHSQCRTVPNIGYWVVTNTDKLFGLHKSLYLQFIQKIQSYLLYFQ